MTRDTNGNRWQTDTCEQWQTEERVKIESRERNNGKGKWKVAEELKRIRKEIREVKEEIKAVRKSVEEIQRRDSEMEEGDGYSSGEERGRCSESEAEGVNGGEREKREWSAREGEEKGNSENVTDHKSEAAVKQRGRDGVAVVEMEKEEDRKELLARKQEMRDKGVEVKEALTSWARRSRYIVAERAVEERIKGRMAWVDGIEMKVEGKEWKWNEREEKWDEEENDRKDGEETEESRKEGNKGT